jgi:hypothetical protein
MQQASGIGFSTVVRFVMGGIAGCVALGGIVSSIPVHAAPPTDVTVFAVGLNDPRGLAFGPDKHLYVAEAGSGGGTLSTVGLCDQIQPPLGPALGGTSGRILEFAPDGGFSVVADHLPSSELSALVGGDRGGVSALAFVGNHMLALESGAGCSHGHIAADNGVFSVEGGGLSMLSNLSAWLLANPGAKGLEQPRNPDYEPDGTWYSMTFDQGRLHAVEPNHGLLVSVHPTDGRVTLVSDLFSTFGDHTYTALAADQGDLYVGTLGRIVFGPGGPDLAASFEAGIYRVSRNGSATQVADGLHAILGLAFDERHRLYALQSPIFVPGTGSLVRVDADGSVVPIVSGLTFPSALTRGPDGAFYLSVCGYHCLPGQGQILRVAISPS